MRDADILLAYFYTYNTRTQSITQLPLSETQSWWLGLEEAHAGNLYLHGYGDRQLGQHKSIKAFGAEDEKLAWEAPDHTFYGIAEAGLLAYPAATPEAAFQLLHPQTGAVIRTDISQQQAAEAVYTYSQLRYNNCVYPMLYLEGEAYFGQVRDFLAQQAGCEPVKAIEYAETAQALVISYYQPAAGQKLDNYLAVFDLEGNILLKATLGSGLSGIGSDTFFIFRENLYFIRNKNSLQVYRLLIQTTL